MASQIVKRGKLFKDIFYNPQLQRSFETHRGLKGSLSLRRGQNYFQQHREYIMQHEKTALLQFLNNYPFNYSLGRDEKLQAFYFEILNMQNFSLYQQSLKYSILGKLRIYTPKDKFEMLSEKLKEQQSKMLAAVKNQQTDAVNAMNLLIYQKDCDNEEFIIACVEALRYANYNILSFVFPKVTPLIIKRVGLNDWNVFRKFDYLLDFIVNDWALHDDPLPLKVSHLKCLVKLQLHLVGYQKIPVVIDQAMNEVCQLIKHQKPIDLMTLQSIFSAFRYLPLTYNQKAYQIIKNNLYSALKQNKDKFQTSSLPLARMNPGQIKQWFQYFLTQDNVLASLVFTGNQSNTRYWMKKTKCLHNLFESYSRTQFIGYKNFHILLVATSLLLEGYEHDTQKLSKIVALLKKALGQIKPEQQVATASKFLPLGSILNLIDLQTKFGLKVAALSYFDQFVQRQAQFTALSYHTNVNDALQLFYNSQNPQIIQCINTIISKIVAKCQKFHFQHFSSFVLKLELSTQSKHYQSTLDALYAKLDSRDCPAFVQIYKRFPHKSFTMTISIVKRIWQKQKSFKSIGKFMTTPDYSKLSSTKGTIAHQLWLILEALEPLLNPEDLNQFNLLQLLYIIKFCHHFYSSTRSFTRKVFLLILGSLDRFNFQKIGVKISMNFVQAAALLASQPELRDQFGEKVLKLLSKMHTIFQTSLLLKTKQIQLGWLLGKAEDPERLSLLVSEILEGLSQKNYSVIYFDVILVLLKMNAIKIVQLNSAVEKKLLAIVLEGLESGEARPKEVFKQVVVKYPNAKVLLIQSKAQALAQIIRKCIQLTPNNRVLPELVEYIDMGALCKDDQIVQSALESISKVPLNPSQLKTVFEKVKYYPSITANIFRQHIITNILECSKSVKSSLTQMLYTLHAWRDTLPQQKAPAYQEAFNQSIEYLLTVTSQTSKKNLPPHVKNSWLTKQLIKILWICVKMNHFPEQSLTIFKQLLKLQKEVVKMLSTQQYEGLNAKFIYYTFQVFSFKLQQKSKQSQSNKIFKKKQTTFQKLNIFNIIPTQPILSEQEQRQLQKSLNNLTFDKNNLLFNHKVGQITFSVYLRHKDQQYGLFILNDQCFNSRGEKKGGVEFMINSLSILSGIKVIPVVPGEAIQLPN